MSDKRDDSLHGRYLRWEGNHHTTGTGDREGPCPVCRAVIQLHSITGRAMRHHIVHDYREHQRKGVDHVGLPMKRSEREMYEKYGSWKERRKQEREKAAKSKAATMRANAHQEPTEAEKRAKAAAKQYVEERMTEMTPASMQHL